MAPQMSSFQLLVPVSLAEEIIRSGDARPAPAYRGVNVAVELIALGASYAGDVSAIVTSLEHLGSLCRKLVETLRRQPQERTTLEVRRGGTRIALEVEGAAAEDELRAAIELLLRSADETV